jgi:hypothetical protein
VSPDAHSPAERADAVLRAAEAAAAAAQAAPVPAPAVPEAQEASLPAPPVPEAQEASLPAPPVPEAQAAPVPAPPVPEAQEAPPAAPSDATPPHAHEAGAPARLLAAAGELETGVGRARAQLDALEDALARVGRTVAQPE